MEIVPLRPIHKKAFADFPIGHNRFAFRQLPSFHQLTLWNLFSSFGGKVRPAPAWFYGEECPLQVVTQPSTVLCERMQAHVFPWV